MKNSRMLIVAGLLTVGLNSVGRAQEPITMQPQLPEALVAREATTPPDKSVMDTLGVLMGALEDNSYSAFLAPANAEFKAALPKPYFEKVVEMFAPRIKAGYKANFIDSVKRKGAATYLWKLKFEDKSDDIIALLTIQEDKVAGFLFL